MNRDQVRETLERYYKLRGNARAVEMRLMLSPLDGVTVEPPFGYDMDWGHELVSVTVEENGWESTHVIPFDSIMRIEIRRRK